MLADTIEAVISDSVICSHRGGEMPSLRRRERTKTWRVVHDHKSALCDRGEYRGAP